MALKVTAQKCINAAQISCYRWNSKQYFTTREFMKTSTMWYQQFVIWSVEESFPKDRHEWSPKQFHYNSHKISLNDIMNTISNKDSAGEHTWYELHLFGFFQSSYCLKTLKMYEQTTRWNFCRVCEIELLIF